MANPETIIIKPELGLWESLNPKKIWRYRDLFYALSERDIKIRHKQTVLGVAWVIFQPVVTALIFTVIFGFLIKIPSNGLPYPLFVLTGLVYWNFFATSLTTSSGSLTSNEALVKKVYFPKIILPLSIIATNLVDFLISMVFLFVVALFYGKFPHPAAFIVLPLSTLIITVATAGAGLFLAAANTRYRDVRFILPFFIQILIFLTPIFFPVSLVSPENRWILSINPLTSVIELTRSLFIGVINVSILEMTISVISSLMIFIIGAWYFAKTEGTFSDII